MHLRAAAAAEAAGVLRKCSREDQASLASACTSSCPDAVRSAQEVQRFYPLHLSNSLGAQGTTYGRRQHRRRQRCRRLRCRRQCCEAHHLCWQLSSTCARRQQCFAAAGGQRGSITAAAAALECFRCCSGDFEGAEPLRPRTASSGFDERRRRVPPKRPLATARLPRLAPRLAAAAGGAGGLRGLWRPVRGGLGAGTGAAAAADGGLRSGGLCFQPEWHLPAVLCCWGGFSVGCSWAHDATAAGPTRHTDVVGTDLGCAEADHLPPTLRHRCCRRAGAGVGGGGGSDSAGERRPAAALIGGACTGNR
mmetsp:Transcript_61672/g.201270  ORF Transcript_61672/g.201270 Transcript_61672/m.201270 type:complete len:307 (+) Transcript_61672:343-1263(+)